MLLIKKEAPPIDLVTQIVRDYFPVAAFEIERVLSGVSTYVYRIRSGKNTSYLRILPEADCSFGVEAHVHLLLRKLGFHVPEVIRFEHRNEAVGMSVMLVNEIPGSDAGDCSSLSEYEDILFAAGKQLAVINQVSVDGFGWVKRGSEQYGTALRAEKNSMHEWINKFLDEDLYALSENILHKNDASRIKSILDSGIELMTRHESKLCHGDFDDSHIFHQHGKYTGIIDFGEIQGSSPFYDLGHFKLHDGQRFRGFDALTEGYNEVSLLTPDDRLEIELWALWIGIRRLGNVCKRAWGGYHEHLMKAVKLEMDILNKIS